VIGGTNVAIVAVDSAGAALFVSMVPFVDAPVSGACALAGAASTAAAAIKANREVWAFMIVFSKEVLLL
jgi:hypothetical protein